MSKSYIQLITARIAKLQDEIDELEQARRVIERLQEDEERRPKGPGTTGASLAELLGNAPVKPKQVRRGPHVQQMLISNILSLLEGIAEPVSSAVIIRELEAQGVSVPKKQRVWAALAKMKKDKHLYHDPERSTYMMMWKAMQKGLYHNEAHSSEAR